MRKLFCHFLCLFFLAGCVTEPKEVAPVILDVNTPVYEYREPNFPDIWPPEPKEWYWWEDGRIFEAG